MGEILLSHRSEHLRDHSQNQSNRGKGGIPFGYERLTPESCANWFSSFRLNMSVWFFVFLYEKTIFKLFGF